MFFEPSSGEATPHLPPPTIPPWLCPSPSEMGTVLAVERVVARSDNVVLSLPSIRVYRTGCLFNLEVAVRPEGLTADEYWDLQTTVTGSPYMLLGRPVNEPLPTRLLRWGVRYADGTKATSIDPMRRLDRVDREPTGPLLRAFQRTAGESSMHAGVVLWLWPLPPPETFELAVEWPLAGIPLTFVEFDGPAIASAAERSTDFWP